MANLHRDPLPQAAARLLDDGRQTSSSDEAIYRGTRAQLIAAGLAQEGDFPGDPGGPIASRTYERGGRKFRLSINSRAANPMTYWVCVTATNAELKAQQRAERASKALCPEDREQRAHAKRVRAAIKAGEYLPLSRRDAPWYTCWFGSREELLASNVCRLHHFPVGTKRVVRRHSEEEAPELRRKGVAFWDTTAMGGDYFKHVIRWDEKAREDRDRNGVGREPAKRPDDILVHPTNSPTSPSAGCSRNVTFFLQS